MILWSTWIAALNIWWITVHSFFWLGINDPDPAVDWWTTLKPEKVKALAGAAFIVIDEVSMLHSNVIDTIDKLCKLNMVMYHNDGKYEDIPFWGVPVLFVWDMFQLPPVVQDKWKKKFERQYRSEFFFDSELFTNNIDSIFHVELKTCYRQWWDIEFANMLDRIRSWENNFKDIIAINRRLKKEIDDKAIILTTTNYLAEKTNNLKLARIKGKKLHIFYPRIKWKYPSNMYPMKWALVLKEWAQIIMLNNDQSKRWVNWSIGTVESIIQDAITVNIDWEIYDVKLHEWSHVDKVWENVIDDDGKPVLNDKGKPKIKMVDKELWAYIQYPMKLAWAITIHKSQWQTFKYVKIDLGNWAFADAQTYVALSRCESLDGISMVTWLWPDDIKVSDRVLSYYNFSLKKVL